MRSNRAYLINRLSHYVIVGVRFLGCTLQRRVTFSVSILSLESYSFSSTQIMPLTFRAKGVSLSTATNWAFNYVVGQTTPYLQDLIEWRLYFMHSFFCVCSFLLGQSFLSFLFFPSLRALISFIVYFSTSQRLSSIFLFGVHCSVKKRTLRLKACLSRTWILYLEKVCICF